MNMLSCHAAKDKSAGSADGSFAPLETCTGQLRETLHADITTRIRQIVAQDTKSQHRLLR